MRLGFVADKKKRDGAESHVPQVKDKRVDYSFMFYSTVNADHVPFSKQEIKQQLFRMMLLLVLYIHRLFEPWLQPR